MSSSNKKQDQNKGQTRATLNDERRRSLILAAYQIIAEKGLEHLRTRDIVTRANVNIATLHYHFASKEDLITNVVGYLLQLFSMPLPFLSERSNPIAWDRIESMFLGIGYRLKATPELFVVLSEFSLRSIHSPSIQVGLRTLDESWSNYIKQTLADGIQQGQFHANLDLDETTRLIILFLKGAIFHQITSGETLDFTQILQNIKRLLLV